ncbi:MAG: ribonuclease HII [Acetivibrionales bacterium]
MEKKLTLKSIEESIKGLEYKQALDHLYLIEKKFGLSLGRLIEKYNKKLAAEQKEHTRYYKMCEYERNCYKKGIRMIAGVDEAGRGPLAGPVVAASVILPEDVFIEGLNDSKKLSVQKREKLFDIITKTAVSYGIGIIDEKQIDRINILNATKLAMKEAVKSMDKEPEILLVDAVDIEDVNIKCISITKGDSLSVSIAAASILAKVTRDRIIDEMDILYPQYGFSKNKGYGTQEHIQAIKKFGICPIHRISFTKKFTG